jgi:hypothetical protein
MLGHPHSPTRFQPRWTSSTEFPGLIREIAQQDFYSAILGANKHTPKPLPFGPIYSCERLVGPLRRECLDFMIPWNERHLR